jgi:tetratricopeptide (TPR) repeat protein
MRLFRNHPTIRYEGVIHESIWPALRRFMTMEGGRVREVDLMLDHVGYEGDQAHKHPRNLPLLLKRLEQDPEHAYSRWHLGATYKGLGDIDRARESWHVAVASARRQRGRDWSHALSFIGLIELDAERPEVVGSLIDEAMQRFPDHPNLLWLKARALMRESRWRDAVAILEDLAAWRRRPRRSDGIVGADKRLFGLFAHDGLATCHFRLEQYKVAAYYYDLAVESAPDPMEYRVKRQLCLKLAGRAAPSDGATPMFTEARVGSRDSATPSSDAPCPAP